MTTLPLARSYSADTSAGSTPSTATVDTIASSSATAPTPSANVTLASVSDDARCLSGSRAFMQYSPPMLPDAPPRNACMTSQSVNLPHDPL